MKKSDKLYQHRPQIAKTNFCVINVENSVTSARNSRQFVWMPLLRMGTQQWHHVHSPKVGRHPPLPPAAMAPSNGTTPPKLVVFLPPNHSTQQWQQWHHSPKLGRPSPFPQRGTLQWHPAMAPSNGTTSTPPKLVATLPPNHTVAHYNGTLRWHAMAPRPLPQSWSSPSPPPTIAHYNGNQQWHHVHSPKVGRHPPPQP